MWLRWALLLVAALLIYKAISRLFSPREPTETSDRGITTEDVLVLDPQCNTYIPRGQAIEARVGKEVLYFCSHACRKQYLQQQLGKRKQG